MRGKCDLLLRGRGGLVLRFEYGEKLEWNIER